MSEDTITIATPTDEEIGRWVVMGKTIWTEGSYSRFNYDSEYATRSLRWMLRQPDYYLRVVLRNDIPAGVMVGRTSINWFSPELVAYDRLVYVMPRQRKYGLGRVLLDDFKNWAWAKGCVRIFVASSLGVTKQAENLYANMGYRRLGGVYALDRSDDV